MQVTSNSAHLLRAGFFFLILILVDRGASYQAVVPMIVLFLVISTFTSQPSLYPIVILAIVVIRAILLILVNREQVFVAFLAS